MDQINILVIGANGFIGNSFIDFLKEKKLSFTGLTRKDLNLLSPDFSALKLKGKNFSHALITAGCTKIAYCENYPEETHKINVDGTLNLTKVLLDHAIFPILFSSDYVFSGKGGDYREDSLTAPTTIYGKQKQELENRLPDITKSSHLLLRLSKIYSLKKGDRSLLNEMANHLTQNSPLQVATDQIFCPLAIDDLIEITLQLIEKGCKGLLNVGGKEKVSRFKLAQKLQIALGSKKETVIPIQLNDLNPQINRPTNTSLNSEKLFQLLDYTPLSIDLAIETIARYHQGDAL